MAARRSAYAEIKDADAFELNVGMQTRAGVTWRVAVASAIYPRLDR